MPGAKLTLGTAMFMVALACQRGHSTPDATGQGVASAGPAPSGAGQSGAIAASRCRAHRDCMVASDTCCAPCGDSAAARATAVPASRCAATECAPCREEITSQVARCAEGSCALLDLTKHPVGACDTDADCVVRAASCCNCGPPLVAVAADRIGDFLALVCDDPKDCLACEAPDTRGVVAACEAGHCRLRARSRGAPGAR